MSPRFDRRPDKRMGTGGRGSGSRDGSSRQPGRPPRFSGPKPEWKRSGDGDAGAPERDSSRSANPRSGGSRSASFGERRPFERRSAEGQRSYGERSFGDRPYGNRGQDQDRPRPERGSTDRPSRQSAGAWDRRPANRSDGPRFDGPRQERPRFNAARPDRRRFDTSRFDASRPEGARQSGNGRDRYGSRPLVVESTEQGAAGESERHGTEASPDLIWGRHSSQATLESGRPIHRIWCTPEMRFSPKFLQLLREAKASGVLVEEVTWARLGQLTGGAVHQGIALQTAAAETLDLPTLIEGCAALGEAPLLMAVDGLTDPHNLGAIVRSAEALGAHGLVLPQRRSAGLTGSVAKVAAGALEHLPVARVVNLNRALDSLKREGYRVVGLAAEGTISLEEADLEGPLVIVTGSESDGISMLTRRNCDQLVRIPLRGATPSLNASVATALLLYEVARRSWMKGLHGSQPAPRIVRPQLPSRPAVDFEAAGHQSPDKEFPDDSLINDDLLNEQLTSEELTSEELTSEELVNEQLEIEQPNSGQPPGLARALEPATPDSVLVVASESSANPDQQIAAGFEADIQL